MEATLTDTLRQSVLLAALKPASEQETSSLAMSHDSAVLLTDLNSEEMTPLPDSEDAGMVMMMMMMMLLMIYLCLCSFGGFVGSDGVGW